MLDNIGYGLRLIRMLRYDKKRNIGAIRVDISATSACNYKCYFCNTHSYLRPQQVRPLYIPTEFLKKALDSLSKLGTKNILFAGNGEPLLHPHLAEVIIQSKGLKIEILTNGSSLYRVNEALMDKLSRLTISLNSGNGKSHKLIHGYNGENQFPQIINQIERILCFENAYNKLKLNYVVTPDNASELKDFKKLIKDYGIDYAIRPMTVDFEEVRHKATENTQSTTLSPCYNGFIQPYIASNGDFLVCCDGQEKPLGNIFQRDLADIWRSEYSRTLIMEAIEMKEPLFKGCVGCANAQLQSKTFDKYYRMIFRS